MSTAPREALLRAFAANESHRCPKLGGPVLFSEDWFGDDETEAWDEPEFDGPSPTQLWGWIAAGAVVFLWGVVKWWRG